MPEFNPALPLPIKFTISENQFKEGEQQLVLTIPNESVTAYFEHITNMVNTKTKEVEVYDFNKKEKVKTKGIVIYAKAMDGQFGIFGNINPQKIEGAPALDQMSF
tara:strand:- start:515 stop:829 length:315 start_codon:yes stop_codon:yes gene_type:complete